MENSPGENITTAAAHDDALPFVAARAVSPLDMSHADFVTALERRAANRGALLDWVSRNLREGVDFGRIHVVKRDRCNDSACSYERNPRHWSKPNMFKPGAEKVTGALGVRATFPAFRDYERAALDGRALTQIILRARMEDAAGNCFGEGIGARGTEEDYGDINKSLKMAAKSAQVDAVLRLAGLSEIFTQGLEDMPAAKLSELAEHPEEVGSQGATTWQPPVQPEKAHAAAPAAPPRPAPAPPAAPFPRHRPSGAPISDAQLRLLHVKLDRAGVSERELVAKYNLATAEELPRSKMDDALAWLASLGDSQ